MILIRAPYISAVPTAIGAGTCINRISTGAVTEPAPTPVRPTASAIRNPSVISSMGSVRLDVDSALELPPAPTPRTRILRIRRARGARLTSNTRVALLVQRQERQSLSLHIGPHLRPRPLRQGTHFLQRLPRR